MPLPDPITVPQAPNPTPRPSCADEAASAEPGTRTAAPAESPRALAQADLADGLKQWWMWRTMAWQDILQRYRGSVLGPFWLTLSMAVMIGTLGILYSSLFRLDLADYLPFLCLGVISWTLISTIVTEGCTAFTQADHIIKQIKMPFSIHVYRVVYRNLIIAAHNLLVYVVVLVVFGIEVGAATLLVIPALALVVLNGVWSALLIGMICARFRDVPQIVASLIQVAFFVSPIIWKPELLGNRLWLAQLNPFYAFIDLLRAPLLGQAPEAASWAMALAVTVAGGLTTFLFFARFRARIPYWV